MVQYCKYSPNSTCRPSSCLLAVLAMLLANSSPISSRETSEMLRHFVLTVKTTQPRPQVFSVNCSIFWQLGCTVDVIFHIAKFLQIWSAVTGYDEICVGFVRSETEKYFE